MIPQRAPVRPRVLGQSGEALLLEEEILAMVETGARGLVQLVGPTGSGKTVALQHLAAVLPSAAPVELVDDFPIELLEGFPAGLAPASANRLVVHARRKELKIPDAVVYRLAPWREDDWIEYLLTAHREGCASVIGRLRKEPGCAELSALPEVWRIVLDEMAVEETVAGPQDALRRYFSRRLAVPGQEEAVRHYCLLRWLGHEVGSRAAPEKAGDLQCPSDVRRILRYRGAQLVLAVEAILAELRAGTAQAYLGRHLPPTLVRAVAAQVKKVPALLEAVRELLSTGGSAVEPMVASILHATDTGWVPDGQHNLNLAGAYLDHAAWPYLRMPGANIQAADLNHAYLHEAVLDGALAEKAKLTHAKLQGASLKAVAANDADLGSADLSLAKAERARLYRANLKGANLEGAWIRRALLLWADLTGAYLAGADLSEASLKGAVITEADFSGCNLQGAILTGLRLREATFAAARFAGANLDGCDLEYMQLPVADFRGASFVAAYLTGSWMPEADFEYANLANAGLADVQWEGASLRRADLRGASFHAGSSRNGLVGSPIACEGSRTGFYTDDSEEQHFKAPEEIRKANLRGADLRGARIDGVDFYLVDLRDALYDAEQEEHLRRCRAILEVQV